MRTPRGLALLAVPLLIATAACAPEEDASDDPTQAASASESPSGDTSPADECAVESLALQTPGQLTVGTDSPAFEPWFVDNDPTNGKGFESAVAYALAEELGFTRDQVSWVKVPFNTSYAPGEKNFDFDINQISITPARAKVVDFSEGYYSAAQAVIAPKTSDVANATSLADLKDIRLGAQTGTTSLSAIRDEIQPEQDPLVFDDTNAAKQALNNDQVDAIVADLPTAFFITAVEIPSATIVGQFQPTSGEQEQFGLLFEKGNPLVSCVDQALGELKSSGQLDAIEQEWLAEAADAPVLD
jgi:polar amino acid transport system substrate-binding protein